MVFPLRAHIQPNSPPTRRSGKKRLAKILTSRLFIIGVLILIQLFLLLFILVRLGTMKYWISVAFTVISFLMVLCILPREDNPSYKISWIILVMAVPLVGGIFYLMFGRKANSRRMAQQIESYTQSLLHIDHGDPLQDKVQSEQTLNLLRRDHPALARQADYIYNASSFDHGLSDEVKRAAALKFSMGRITMPHQLARLVLTEQIYRACTINAGMKYHK